jgi:hypothetical protein
MQRESFRESPPESVAHPPTPLRYTGNRDNPQPHAPEAENATATVAFLLLPLTALSPPALPWTGNTSR